MQLNIEEQIPITTKFYRNNMVLIPATVRSFLEWNEGDELQIYATTKGIFIKNAQNKDKGGE